MSTVQEAPTVSVVGPSAFGTYRLLVDGEAVVTVQSHGGKLWRCDPGHQHGMLGGAWGPVGEHLVGCGWVQAGAEWHVYLSRALGTGRFYGSLPRALQEARRMAEGYTRCSRPVACRLCRLPKRHEGACVPWD